MDETREVESENDVTVSISPGATGILDVVFQTHADERVGFAILAELTHYQATALANLLLNTETGA